MASLINLLIREALKQEKMQSIEYENLPHDKTLCQLLAWLFQTSDEGSRRTSEFYQFRQVYPKVNLDIRKRELKEFCQVHKEYLTYSRINGELDALVGAVPACQNLIFREKLRQISPANKKAEQLWTIKPLISEAVIKQIQLLPFQTCSSNTSTLVKEWCKRLSFLSQEKLYSNSVVKEELLECSSNLGDMAREHKMSPVHLAQVLLGVKAFSDTTQIQANSRKLEIHRQAMELSNHDCLFGYLLNDSARIKLKKNGGYGEMLAKGDLDKLGIVPSLYKTEDQQKAAAAAAAIAVNDRSAIINTEITEEEDKGETVRPENHGTPDFLFDSPVLLFGKEIKWLEVKNYVIVPGISADIMVQKLLKQVTKYLGAYGAGMILFTRIEGFSQSLRDLIPPEIIIASRLPDDIQEQRLQRNRRRDYRSFAFNLDVFRSLGNNYTLPISPFQPAGHILGGTADRNEYINRLQENLKQIEQQERAKIVAEMQELLDTEIEIYCYMQDQLFKTADQLQEDFERKLLSYVQTILQYKIDNKGDTAIRAIKKIISNIIENPDNMKYKRFNSKAKVFSGIIGVSEFFIMLGFQPSIDQPDFLELVKSNLELLLIAQNKLNLN